MLRRLAYGGALLALAGCEWVAGISDKTLVSSGVGVPCARQPAHLFCDDFDSESTFGQLWAWHTTAQGGAFAFDTHDYASPSRSARFTGTVDGVSSSQLGLDGVSAPRTLRAAFDLRVDVADASSLPEVSVLQVLTATTGLSINYVIGPGAQASLQVFDPAAGEGPAVTVAIPAPPVRAWTNLVVSTDWQTVLVVEDGKTLTSTKSPAVGTPGAIKVISGIVYVNPTQGASPPALEIDDFVLEGS